MSAGTVALVLPVDPAFGARVQIVADQAHITSLSLAGVHISVLRPLEPNAAIVTAADLAAGTTRVRLNLEAMDVLAIQGFQCQPRPGPAMNQVALLAGWVHTPNTVLHNHSDGEAITGDLCMADSPGRP